MRRKTRYVSTGEYAPKRTALEMKRKVGVLCGRGSATVRKSGPSYELLVKSSCRRWADIYNPSLMREAGRRRR